MNFTRTLTLAIATAVAAATLGGCAVARNQQTVGAYVDDATITTKVKARFVEDKIVDAGAINVQTLNGTVNLSGFAKSSSERSKAETLARGVDGVREVRNTLAVRP